MLINLFKKFFKKRRSDVSLKVFARFLFLLSYYKILKKIKSEQSKNKSCLILFPPSLGLGDLIILSKIVNIVKESKRYKSISIGHSAPYLQKIDNSISLIDLKKPKELVYFNEVILPSPSLLNGMISFIIGRKKCKGC